MKGEEEKKGVDERRGQTTGDEPQSAHLNSMADPKNSGRGLLMKRLHLTLGATVHICNLSIWEPETLGLQVSGQDG